MEFKEVTIGEICNLVTDYVANGSFKSLAENVKYSENGYARLIRLVDFNNKFSNKDSIWIEKSAYEFLSKSKLFGDEIIITNVGANLGTVLFMPHLSYPSSLAPNSIMIKTNQNDRFIYYLLKSKYGQSKIKAIVSGSAMPKFNKTDFKKIKIEIPNIKYQNKIVNIIDAVDNKIKLNNKINESLLNVLDQLYNAYINSINNTNNQLISSKELLNYNTGIEPGSKAYKEQKGENDIEFYRVGDLNSTCKTFISSDLEKSKIANEEDILVSFDATIGRIGYGIKGVYSSGIKKITPKKGKTIELNSGFILAYFRSKEVEEIMSENAKGTTILHASSAIDYLKIRIQNETIYKLLNELDIIFKKLLSIKKQNEKLEQLRDTLLPKLMKGEINLDKIEI